MYHSHINVRYAKSIFLLAEERKVLDEIKRDIDLIIGTFQDVEDFNVVLEHPVIKPSKKNQIIDLLFKDKINPYTLSFLHLIIKNKRENHLKSICINFIALYKKNKGIKTAVLTTAYQLSEDEKKNIKQSIEANFKSIIELEEKVDSDIIGGMIIQVDDKQLDLSVAKQIESLRKQFLNIDFNNKKVKH